MPTDITLTYTEVDLKSCHILNILWVGVQVDTWQAIHHGFTNRKDLNGIATIRVVLKTVLLLTQGVRSDQISCSSIILFLAHHLIHRLLRVEELKILASKFYFPEDARKILEWTNIRLQQGDESFLDDKLGQLRMLDRQGWLPI